MPERDWVSLWLAVIDQLHYTPKWRWKKRRLLNQRLDEIERLWDAPPNHESGDDRACESSVAEAGVTPCDSSRATVAGGSGRGE